MRRRRPLLLQRGGGFCGPNLGPAGPLGTGSVAGPKGDRCALRPRPVDYRFIGGGSSLPRGCGSVDPVLIYPLPSSRRPRGGLLGEMTLVAALYP